MEVETEKGWERSGGRMGEREEGQETEITAMIYSISLPYQTSVNGHKIITHTHTHTMLVLSLQSLLFLHTHNSSLSRETEKHYVMY